MIYNFRAQTLIQKIPTSILKSTLDFERAFLFLRRVKVGKLCFFYKYLEQGKMWYMYLKKNVLVYIHLGKIFFNWKFIISDFLTNWVGTGGKRLRRSSSVLSVIVHLQSLKFMKTSEQFYKSSQFWSNFNTYFPNCSNFWD